MNRAKRKARQAGNKQKSRDTEDIDDVELKKIKIEVKEESTSSCGTAIITLYYFVIVVKKNIYI